MIKLHQSRSSSPHVFIAYIFWFAMTRRLSHSSLSFQTQRKAFTVKNLASESDRANPLPLAEEETSDQYSARVTECRSLCCAERTKPFQPTNNSARSCLQTFFMQKCIKSYQSMYQERKIILFLVETLLAFSSKTKPSSYRLQKLEKYIIIIIIMYMLKSNCLWVFETMHKEG